MISNFHLKILIITCLIALLFSMSSGYKLKIGGLFDTDDQKLQRSFRCAVKVANKEILSNSSVKLAANVINIPYGNEFAAYKSLCKLLESGTPAVIGPSAPATSGHCINICDAKEIPYIGVNWYPDTKPPVINVHPYPEAVAQIFVELITSFKWEKFTIIYESASWLRRVANLLKSHTVTLRRINVGMEKTNFRPVLRRVKLSGDKNIVLDCTGETLPEVLKQAQQVGLLTDEHQFLITTMDMSMIDLEPYQYSGAYIIGIRLVDPENPMMGQKCLKKLVSKTFDEEDPEEPKNVIDSPTPTMSIQSALIFDAVLLLAEAFKQFKQDRLRPRTLHCESNDAYDVGNSITNFMRNTIVQGLTGEIRFDHRGYRSDFAVDVISLNSSGISKVGMWNATGRLNITTRRIDPKISKVDDGSMRNKKFIILIALTPPYGMLRNTSLNLVGNERYEGFGIELIQELSELLGFDYEFRVENDYGEISNVTDDWTGMIKQLRNGTADLAITDLTITEEREKAVDFTMPFLSLGIALLYKKADPEPPNPYSFMAPFSMQVWGYLGGAYLGVSLCLFFLGRIDPSEWDNPYPCIEEPEKLENQFSGFGNSLWFVTGALLQQGSEIAPKGLSTRVAATTWWFFTLIMVASYTANLAACLTFEKPGKQFKGVDALKDCHIKGNKCPTDFGAKKFGSTFHYFRKTDNEVYRNMFTYMLDHPASLTANNEDGLQRARNGSYAFLMESATIEYYIERYCELTKVGDNLDEKGYGIAMKKDSVYRSALSKAILLLQEQGKLHQMKTKWWKEKTKGTVCSAKKAPEHKALAIKNIEGVFYVLIAGSLCATLYGIAEWLTVIYLRARRENVPFQQEFSDEWNFIVHGGGHTKKVRHRRRKSMNSSLHSRCSVVSDRSGKKDDGNGHSRES